MLLILLIIVEQRLSVGTGRKKKGCRQAAVGTQLPHGGLLTVIK